MYLNKYSAFFCITILVLLSGCRPRAYYAYPNKLPDQSTRATCAIQFTDDRYERNSAKKQLVVPSGFYRKFSELSLNELQDILAYSKSIDNKEVSVKAIQHMIPLCNDQISLEKLRLEVADLHFDLGKLEQAEKLYKEFVKLYPNSPYAEYALYKNILCRYYEMLSCDRDQTVTQEAIALTHVYLQNSEVFKQYVTDVQSIEKQCYSRLFEHELSVFDFYLNKGNFKAAQTRLESIKTTFSKALPEKEATILLAEIELANVGKNTELMALKEAELLQKFPELKSSVVALAKKSYVTLF